MAEGTMTVLLQGGINVLECPTVVTMVAVGGEDSRTIGSSTVQIVK